MTKIKNWIKEHNYIAGVALLFVSLASIAFGFAYFGMNKDDPDDMDESIREVEDEFIFE